MSTRIIRTLLGAVTLAASGGFVPVLMGAGVLMSGIAWVVERLARATAAPVDLLRGPEGRRP